MALERALERCLGLITHRIRHCTGGHGWFVAFQMAEVAISKNLFAEILRMIAELRPPPVASTG